MADTTFVNFQTPILAEWLNDVNDLTYNISGTGPGQGASQIGVQDTAGDLAATNVETALAEIATLVGKKFINPYITSFGVKGDYNPTTFAGTDDTAALNAVIDYAATRGGGAIMLAGYHKISGQIALQAGVVLVSAAIDTGRIATTEKSAASLHCTGPAASYDAVRMGAVTGDKYPGIVGIAIHGNGSAANGITVNGYSAAIVNCSVTRARYNGIQVNSGGAVTKIRDTYVLYPGRHGIVIDAADCQIDGHCEVQQPNNVWAAEAANTYSGIYVTGGTLQMTGGRNGDDTFRSKHNIEVVGGNIQISNWDVQQAPLAGISLTNSVGSMITGCRIVTASTNGSSCGIQIAGTTSVVSIVGNYFNNSAAVARGAIYFDAAYATPSSISIASNTAFGNWYQSSPTGTGLAFINITTAQRLAAVNCYFENAQNPMRHTQPQDISGSATPALVNGVFCDNLVYANNGGATTITDITGGYPGQTLIIESSNGNTTIQHGAAISLQGAVNFVMAASNTLSLVRAASSMLGGVRWIETGRKT